MSWFALHSLFRTLAIIAYPNGLWILQELDSEDVPLEASSSSGKISRMFSSLWTKIIGLIRKSMRPLVDLLDLEVK